MIADEIKYIYSDVLNYHENFRVRSYINNEYNLEIKYKGFWVTMYILGPFK